MKYIFLLCLLATCMVAVNAQKYLYPAPSQTAWDDTIKADTNYYPSATSYIKSVKTTGAISFTFYHVDKADSLKFARIEWSDDLLTWTAMTGNAALSLTTTDGQSKVYTSTPLTALYYRAMLACASGDTVAITNPTLMHKED